MKHLLIVDGYNVIHQSDTLRLHLDRSLEDARDALIAELVRYQDLKQMEVWVVFDGVDLPFEDVAPAAAGGGGIASARGAGGITTAGGVGGATYSGGVGIAAGGAFSTGGGGRGCCPATGPGGSIWVWVTGWGLWTAVS